MTKNPTLQELADLRKKSINEKLNVYNKTDKFAKVVENEKKSIEFPNAIVENPDEVRSVYEFYADGKNNEQQNINANVDVKFAKLFAQYGTPQYVAEIVDALSNSLNEDEKKYLIQNASMLKKKIKDNLSVDTTVNFFIDFVESLVVEKKDTFDNSKRISVLKQAVRKGLDAVKRLDGKIYFKSGKFTFKGQDGLSLAGYASNSKANRELKAAVQEIKVLDKRNGGEIVTELLRDYLEPEVIEGEGFNFKRKQKRYLNRPKNLRIVRGGGIEIMNPNERVSKKVFNSNNETFYELNKYIIDVEKLNKENICDIRYSLNGRKLRQFKCPNEKIKGIIINLCEKKTFSLNQFNKLDDDDKKFIMQFCEKAHVDIGISNQLSDLKTQYSVYEGELNAGNPTPMLQFLLKSFNSGQLKKKEYLEALNEIYKQEKNI